MSILHVFVFSLTQLLSYESKIIAFAASNNSSSWTGALNPHSTSSSSWTEVLEEAESVSTFTLEDYRAQNADEEARLFSRIRNLENRLIDRLPPQLHHGEYANLVRDNLNQAINIQHYQSVLHTELFDITVLELKANLQDRLFSRLVSAPDARLTQICVQSPFQERAIRPEALEFLDNNLNSLNLNDPRSHYDKVLVEQTLRYWLQDLHQNGNHSILYRRFLLHFLGEG